MQCNLMLTLVQPMATPLQLQSNANPSAAYTTAKFKFLLMVIPKYLVDETCFMISPSML